MGTEMQRYHLFGKLMTEVEVLESTAPEGRVQVSQESPFLLNYILRCSSLEPIGRGEAGGEYVETFIECDIITMMMKFEELQSGQLTFQS